MPNWKDRLAAAPLWGVALTTAAVLSAYFGGIALAAGEPAGTVLNLALAGCGLAAVLSAIVGANRWWLRRVAGRRPQAARIATAAAFRTGEPPDDPSLDEPILALIERRRAGRERLRRWRLAALIAGPLVIAAGLYLHVLPWGALIALLATIVFVTLPQERRRRTVERRLERRIRARQSGSHGRSK